MNDIRATYRLQVRGGTTLDDVAELVPYLADLGVSHLYLSPVLTAAPGSTHGYDVVDPATVDPAIGGRAALDRLHRASERAGLGLVLDIVPNHVAVLSPANAWWWDVLARGPDSRYAPVFDIDWRDGPTGRPQVLVPTLGRPLLDELMGDDLRLAHDDGWRVVYHDHAWPLRDGSLQEVGLDPDDVAATLATVAGDRGRLLSILLRQHYELAHWRRANDDLNYRRFFDITTLGGVRVEDPDVFDLTHATVLDLVRNGIVDGLRLDHPDGLRDPVGYFRRLRRAAPDAWIVAEKILEWDEPRRPDWSIDGTVGYAFANRLLGLFVDRSSLAILSELYAAVTGDRDGFEDAVLAAKRQVAAEFFGAEVDRVVALLAATLDELGVVARADQVRASLTALLVGFPVYRTYLRPGEAVGEADRRALTAALARARLDPDADDDVLEAIAEVAGLGGRDRVASGDVPAEFLARLQQLTGPVMAKGVEDTAFYRWLRFAAANEVGGDPGHPATSLGDFHEANLARQHDFPTTMLATSTHDTKRSEDVRARLAVVTELSDDWVRAVTEWRELARPHRGAVGPSPRHEYLVLQTLVGTWPITPERLEDYLVKAAREGKQESHWLHEDVRYEEDLVAFARAVLDDDALVASIAAFVDHVREPGWLNSLSQTLLKLTSPGVPDVYQGCELWDLSLVDPDNRRPVDFARRRRQLAELRHDSEPEDVLAGMDTGLPKLWVTAQALDVRRALPDAFGRRGTYRPLWARGRRAGHVVAFARGEVAVTVAPRLPIGLGGPFLSWDWQDTQLPLPAGAWRDVMSGSYHDVAGPVPLSRLLNRFPVALLVRED